MAQACFDSLLTLSSSLFYEDQNRAQTSHVKNFRFYKV